MRKALLVAAALFATPALAQANPQIDYPAFQTLAARVAPQIIALAGVLDADLVDPLRIDVEDRARAERQRLRRQAVGLRRADDED